MKIYTVAIIWGDTMADPFISAFSTREAAEAYAEKAAEHIRAKGYDKYDFRIEFDSGNLDSEEYLDYIDEEE